MLRSMSARRAALALILVATALAAERPGRPALAQASQQALDSLQPAPAAHHPAHGRHAARHGHAHAATGARKAAGAAARPPAASGPAAVGAPPPIPAAPPPPPVIAAPVVAVPLHPEPPPPPVPVVAQAAGNASRLAQGTRITFGKGSADLNAATMQALRDFAASLRADPAARADLDAFAAGGPDDPSTPRRLSLSRGLAARAVLINAGTPATRIYVRVIGAPSDGGPADRVDLARVANPNQPAASGAGRTAASAPSPAPTPAPVTSQQEAAPNKAGRTP